MLEWRQREDPYHCRLHMKSELSITVTKISQGLSVHDVYGDECFTPGRSSEACTLRIIATGCLFDVMTYRTAEQSLHYFHVPLSFPCQPFFPMN